MKIILDDQRSFPNGPYNCVRTYEECVYMIRIFAKLVLSAWIMPLAVVKPAMMYWCIWRRMILR